MKKKILHPLFIALLCCIPVSNFAQKPNIVLIYADDWGWTDWQMNGRDEGSTFYQTPNLNQLSQEGMYFNQAYTHPLCSPSRAALLTGKYPGSRFKMHQAITGNSVANPTMPTSCGNNSKTCFPENRDHLPLNEITIAEELKRAGYQTYHFGKWHLGNSNYYPTKQGFDTQFAVGGAGPGQGGYFAPYAGLSDIPQGPDGEYIAERITDEVCKKLEQVKNDKFFIYMAHYNVHSPYEGKPGLVEKYDSIATKNPADKHKHPTMGAMIESLDASIGKVMEKLNELGIADSTLLIVMGDNGGIHWANDKNIKYKDINITSNAPLRAGKACFYEGGVRVPLIIKYPVMVDPNKVENTPVHSIDFYPTLLELAGIAASPAKDVIDGVSIVNLLTGSGKLKERPIFCHFPRPKQIGAPVGGSYVRMGNYKLCRLYGLNNDASDAYELYNIEADPGEQADSAAFLTEIRDSLKIMLQNWLIETDAFIPIANPNWTGYVDPNTDAPTDLTASIIEGNELDISWTDNSDNEKGYVIEQSTNNGSSWGIIDTVPANTTEYITAVTKHLTYYLFRVYADYTDSISAVSGMAGGRLNLEGDDVPSPWQTTHFGDIAAQAQATFSNDTFIVDAADFDAWGTEDRIHFVYQPMVGDNIMMTTQVVQNDYPHGYAQAGIMFRNTLKANSNQVSMFLIGDQGCGMRERLEIGGETNQNPLQRNNEKAPYWLRLKREGNTFTGYHSANGINWTQERSVSTEMGDTILVGLASASHSLTENSMIRYANVYFGEGSGIGANINRTGIKVYPNPANSTINIELAGNTNNKFNCSVSNLAGQVVFNLNNIAFVSNIYTLQDHAIPQGIYIIKVASVNTGNVFVQKVIIE